MKTRDSIRIEILFLTLLFLTSCNKEDYYQKDYLDNPFQSEPTPEVDEGDKPDSLDEGGADKSDPINPPNTDSSDTNSGDSDSGQSNGGNTNFGDCNQGHGNDPDGIDESNPTIATEPKCKMDSFTQASRSKKLDILWVIDNSGSMADNQIAIGENFSAFIDDFIRKDIDFKMAITSTDTSSPSSSGRIVEGSEEKLTSAAAKINEFKFKDDFKELIRIGTTGSSVEKGLEASEAFFQRYSGTFLRDDAYLIVVIVSDEEDQSPKLVSTYVNYLKSMKSEQGLVKIYSIADINNSNQGYGINGGAARYIDASESTAGLISNINADFYETLSLMGDSVIKLVDSFPLSNNPEPSSIKVFVNGVESRNFIFDASSLSIKFMSQNVPEAGDKIKVYYTVK